MPELLPLGSIVKLKQDEIPVMIIGYYPVVQQKTRYEYSCVPYPFGLEATKKIVLINGEDIQQVDTRGYQTKESQMVNLVLQETYRRFCLRQQEDSARTENTTAGEAME